MRKNLVLTPLMVALASGCAMYAQDTTSAVLAGRVVADQDNRPLRGVRVLLNSPALLTPREVTTGPDGYFRVQLLPGGQYTITYILNGYVSSRQTLRLLAGQTANANARLKTASVLQETIEIAAQISERTQVDKTDTVNQTAFSSDFLEKIVGRGWTTIGQMTPGLNTTNLATEEDLKIRGGTGHGTKTLVNGTSVTEMWGGHTQAGFISLPDMIESMAVIQSPLNSRYGNTDGGIVSVITSKGSNTFSGSIRLYTGRDYWNTVDNGYPRRNGTSGTTTVSGNDNLRKSWDVTIKGPLWKDHITFAYGANLVPTSTWVATQNLFYNNGNGTWGRAQDQVGTYFKAGNGDVIRIPELYRRNVPNGAYIREEGEQMNQFTLYGQITPNHQLDWGYRQLDRIYINATAHADGPWNREGRTHRDWNLGYKGILGTSGILDFRMAQNNFNFWFGDRTNPTYPIYTASIASRIPINPNGDLGDPNNYYSSGLVGSIASASIAQNPNDYRGQTWSHSNGYHQDWGDNGGTRTIMANYQHHLDTKMGTHLIDVGFNNENFEWNLRAWNPPRAYWAPGQLAYSLTPNDIYNASGVRPSQAYIDQNYAGKFIVFNTTTARLSTVDPLALSRYGIQDSPFLLQSGQGTIVARSEFINIMPQVDELFGNENGGITTETMSFYVNDMWTINDNHSVMLGARFDNFKVYDFVYDIHSYSQPTFRFEYKWDVSGDQSRLFNVSWGQFHNNLGAGVFFPMVHARLTNTRTRYWSVGGSEPYLVSKEEFLNINNYGNIEPSQQEAGQNARVDKNFKAPISTEITVGMRRNLSNGGSYKITYVNRTWTNDYDYYPGEQFVNELGTMDIERILKNGAGNERVYNSLELEWDLPITKRILFGGWASYTRFWDNTSTWTDDTRWWQVRDGYRLNMDAWWDEKTGGRNVWKPPTLQVPEFQVNFHLMFDLSSKKLDSSLTFQGGYTSGGFASRSDNAFPMGYGYPNEKYSKIIASPAGGAMPNSIGTTMFGNNYVWVPLHVMSTGNDSWGINARYLLTVPLINKLAWHARISISNVFNHRGIGGWFSPQASSDAVIYPYDLKGPNGNVQNAANLGRLNGIWRSAGGNWTGLYQGRMGGRSFGVETGLRF